MTQYNRDDSPMDSELRLIRYLYGEEERPEEVERLLAADGVLRAEYRRMNATKQRLDARARQRPDAAVVDRIVAAAGVATPDHAPAEVRTDRAPVARTRRPRNRVLGVTSALAAVLVVVSVGIWQWDGHLPGSAAPDPVVEVQSATTDSRSEAAAAGEESALPAWNEANDELVRLHHYIETLHGRSSPESWDAPGTGFQPASQVRPSGR